jgi:alanyl-tRNA synthetase
MKNGQETMTQRLYYDDAYTLAFTADVTEHLMVGEQPAVILNHTYFYPAGGGQPHDTGTIEGIPVLDVFTRDSDHAVVHVLSQEINTAAGPIRAKIDRARRTDHMQQHTGQHILTQAFVQVAGAQTVGFHLSVDTVTIDLDRINISEIVLDQAESLANEVIYRNLKVTPQLVDPACAEGVRMRKMPGQLLTDGLRVVAIGDFDLTACGGTHVAATGEIGMIKIIRTERRGDKTRVEFCCGQRALNDYRRKNRVLLNTTAALNCGFWEVDQSAIRMQEQIKGLQRQHREATNRLLEVDASALLASASAEDGIRIIKAVVTDYDAEQARILARKLVESDGIIALVAVPDSEKATLLMGRSQNLPHDMNTPLKAALAALNGGRGGGRPDFVQGGGIPADTESLRAALDAAEAVLREG